MLQRSPRVLKMMQLRMTIPESKKVPIKNNRSNREGFQPLDRIHKDGYCVKMITEKLLL